MKKNIARPTWMAVIACTLGVSLSGCADLATRVSTQLSKTGTQLANSGNPGSQAGGTLNGNTQLGTAITAIGTAGHALIQDTVASLQANAEMEVQMLAEDMSAVAGYQVMAAGQQQGGLLRRASQPAQSIRQAIKKHQDMMRQKGKAKLDARKGATKVSERVVKVNDDGSRTVTSKVEVTNKQGTQKHSFEKLVDADGTILDYVGDAERTGKDGRSVVSHRERHTEDDGSFKATFTMVITRKDGAKKTIEWTRTGAADGSETGEGKIVRFDGSTVTTSITRSTDGTIVTKTTDSAAKVEAEVKTDDLGTTTEATITNTETGQVEEKVEVDVPETVEASDK